MGCRAARRRAALSRTALPHHPRTPSGYEPTFVSTYFTEMRSGSEAGSYLMLIGHEPTLPCSRATQGWTLACETRSGERRFTEESQTLRQSQGCIPHHLRVSLEAEPRPSEDNGSRREPFPFSTHSPSPPRRCGRCGRGSYVWKRILCMENGSPAPPPLKARIWP